MIQQAMERFTDPIPVAVVVFVAVVFLVTCGLICFRDWTNASESDEKFILVIDTKP